jgi:FixJ family two-component response regulator
MKRVAVVDDEKGVRELYCNLLEENGYQPISFEQPKEFLATVGRDEYDLLLLDYSMPEVSGARVIEELLNHDFLRSLPVLVISGILENAIEIPEEKKQHYLAISYMKKPCKLSWLLSTVESLVKLRHYYMLAGASV